MQLIKSLVSFAIALFALISVQAQSLYFPPNVGSSWDTLSPNALGWCQPRIDSLYAYLDREDSKAFILLKGGKIVLEKYFDTFTKDSLWYWASAGKTLTAFTVGIAQQEGYLSISDTTASYLGQGWTVCPPNKEEKITIRHQLTMTSGLNDGVPDHYCTLDTCLQYLADAGTRWAYHNGPYTLLDGVIANATGQSLNTYFGAKVKAPIGMNGLFVQSGYNNVYVSNARSMARFGLLMLAGGTWNGNPVMTDTAYFNQMINTSQSLNRSYGYLWWLNGKQNYMVPGLQLILPGSMCPLAPNDMYAALGKNGQVINVVPSQDMVWIRMGNAPTSAEVPYTMVDSVWKRLNDMSCSTASGSTVSSSLKVYPVPSQGMIQVEVPQGIQIQKVECLNLAGSILQAVKGSSASEMSLLLEVAPGCYFLRVFTDQGIWLHRVMVDN